MNNSDTLASIYTASNGGLDIILDICPQAKDSAANQKKAFRLRPDERTPSAYLYQPSEKHNYWSVKDYGMGEGGGYFSPIDLYMWDRKYSQDKFRIALGELAERYGIQEQLSRSVNKPDIEQRPARPEELGAEPRIERIEGFSGVDLSCWGEGVTPEHLATYGWSAVSKVTITSGDKVYVRKSTTAYPVFSQQCDFLDAQGNQQSFFKVYEPKNPDKAHRFLIVGKKPQQQNYIYGLSAVRRKFEEQGEEKLPVLLLVSGGSDAVSALSKGYLAVWMDSETKGLPDSDYNLLLKYARRIVNIPDIDSTGIRMGRQLALQHPGLYTAWLNTDDMGGLHDNRGKACKDLRDYCRLHPQQKAMSQLVARAKKAKFWSDSENKQGQKEYTLSLTALNYFLELNGFYTLKDETRREPVYIRIDGICVQPVTAKAIVAFLKGWMEQQGLPKALQDKVLRSHDLPTNNVSMLSERDDLDFSRSTATTQRFYFRNCWAEVSAEHIVTHRYSESDGHYVWQDSIIQHDYRAMPDMFTVSTGVDGRYVVTLTEGMQLSNLLKFLVNTSRLYWRKTDEGGQPLTTDEVADENRCLASHLANLGYLLCNHKSESEAWATICLDSTMAESVDECNGRSGKSFYVNAVAKMAKTFKIDAGTTSFKDPRFIFDGVTEDTSLVFIDECPRKFDYNFVYGMVTGDCRVEEKNRHSFVIPFAQSPKFVLATNFTLPRHDPSTEGRMWPQPFSDYYHVKTPQNDYRESRSIRDDFGKNLMGTEYDEHDWQLDLAFMTQCVRFYLSLPQGERRIMPPLSRIERREQMAAVGRDFRQWADDYFAEDSGRLDCDLKAEQVLADFNQETKFGWSPKKMTQHLNLYCQLADHIQCLNPAAVTHKAKDGERWVKRDENNQQKAYYYVQSVKAASADTAKTASVQAGLDFEPDPTEGWVDGEPF
ncbi:MAG: hypothetical protein II822_02630 [Prevotella sp.]|nr:hypothetical protein [Prevotella sp.]